MKRGRDVMQSTLEYETVYDNGNSGAAFTMTLSNGQHQKVTLTAASVALTLSASGAANGVWSLSVVQDATGSRVIGSATVSGGTVLTEGGEALAFTATGEAEDTLIVKKEGTTYRLKLAGADWQEWI